MLKAFLKVASYVRGFFLTPFAICWTMFSAVLVLLCVGLGFSKENFFYIVKNVWSRVIVVLSGVEIEKRGMENLPPGGCLYVFNHTSNYDILVIFVATPRVCYFGAKSELFKIPIFGPAMAAGGALRIERSNRAKVLQIYKEAEVRVAKGDIFVLAPEGTRQKGRGFLGPFKSGPFIFAANAHMPVVPVVLVGCENIMTKKSFFPNLGRWKQKVIFEFLEPIHPKNNSDEEIQRIRDLTFERMSQKLKEYWT